MIHLIDALHLGTPHIVCVALVECGPAELMLVDSGPESVFQNVVEGVRKLGFDPTHVRHLLASHIHLDHTGGAWRWANEFGTRVYVHPKGAPHLVDPSKLISSATKIYGEKLGYLWGAAGPIREEQVVAVEEGTKLRFGSKEIDVLYTPGHAPHHNSYWLEEERTVFAGDVAGVLIPGGPAIPPFPPPDIHLETWKASLDKIRRLNPDSIHITHWGRIDRPKQTLDALEERLFRWAEWVRQRMIEGKSESEMVTEFEQFTSEQLLANGTPKELLATYEQADPAFMSVAGLTRYWRKCHPEKL